MKNNILLSLSRVRPTKPIGMDSVSINKKMGDSRTFSIIMEAQHYWNAMDRFRRDRERNRRYCYNEQWNDVITVDGRTMTEKEYIKSQGNIPLQTNLIRRLVRNVLGLYLSQSTEPLCVARDRDEQALGETMTTVLQYNMQLNEMNELLARSFEEFLIGGLIVHRKSYGWRNDRMDCWTDYVNPDNFFVDCDTRDFRNWDIHCIGEIHDIEFGALCSRFAQSPSDFARLKEIYRYASNRDYLLSYIREFGYPQNNDYRFLYPSNTGLCRVIEVWRKETKPRYRCHDYNNGEIYKIEIKDLKELVLDENQRRIKQGKEFGMSEDEIPLIKYEWFIDDYWYFYYLSPFGDILQEGETPYTHKSHPYVIKAYPFLNGEIHSYVSDFIDQQRYVNRLVTMYDWIMRASAKGLLMFPDSALPDGYSMEDIAEEWSKFNGMIVYSPKPGIPAPHQIANNCTNIGITELLSYQLKLMEDISGVHGALQGRTGRAGESGSLYAQQAQNATTSLLDLVNTFNSFIRAGAKKDVKNIQQFYDDMRVVNIAGKKGGTIYDPKKLSDVEFDLSIVEGTVTPAFRQAADEILLQLWHSQAISVEQLLENASFPFADNILQSIKAQKEQMNKGEIPDGLSPDIKAQLERDADSETLRRLQEGEV